LQLPQREQNWLIRLLVLQSINPYPIAVLIGSGSDAESAIVITQEMEAFPDVIAVTVNAKAAAWLLLWTSG
jgi:hypothetical protein